MTIQLPQAPSVSLNPVQTPSIEARRVVPLEDQRGRQMQALGGALEDAGATAARIGETLQATLDEAKVREADAKLADADREALTGPNGYLGLTGRAALDAREAARQRIIEHRTVLSSTMQTPRQKALFAQVAESRRQRALLTIDGHYAEQLQVYDRAETEARAKALLRDATDAYFLPLPSQEPQDVSRGTQQGPPTSGAPSPIAVAAGPDIGPPRAPAAIDPFFESKVAYLDEIDTLARKQGLGPEQTKELREKATDALHQGIVERLLAMGDPVGAAHYLARVSVGAPLKADLISKIRTGVTKDTAQRITSELIGAGGDLLSNLHTADQGFRAGTISVEVYDEVRQRLSEQQGRMRTEAAAAREDAWRVATEYVQQHGTILTEPVESLIRANHLEDRFDTWVRQGMQDVTDRFGQQLLYVQSAETLNHNYPTEADLVGAATGHVTTADLGKILERYRRFRSDQPKPDPQLAIGDRLMTLTKTTDPKLLDKDVLAHFADRVNYHYGQVFRESPAGTPDGAIWKVAIDRASQEGVYRDRAMTDFVPAVSLISGRDRESVSDGWVKLADGTIAQISLDAIYPAANMTYGQTVDAIWTAQSQTEEPGKPFGWVWVQGKAMPYQSVTISDRMREAATLRRPVEEKRKETARVNLRNAWQVELARAARDAESGTGSDEIRYRAIRAMVSRLGEWSGFGVTVEDIADVSSTTPEQRKAALEIATDPNRTGFHGGYRWIK